MARRSSLSLAIMKKPFKAMLWIVAIAVATPVALYIALYWRDLYVVTQNAHSVVMRVHPWMKNSFPEFVRNWEPESAWLLLTPPSRDYITHERFIEMWRQQSIKLGQLIRYEEPTCSHGIEAPWPWISLGWAVVTKCFVNASYQKADVVFIFDIEEYGETLGIQRFTIGSRPHHNDG